LSFILLISFLCIAALNISLYIATNGEMNWEEYENENI